MITTGELEITELQTLNPNPVLQLGLEYYNLMAYIFLLISIDTGILVGHELIRFTLDASSPAK
jgi:hypothetical protein